MYEFKLYLVDHTAVTAEAVIRLEGILEARLGGKYVLDVISVMDDPESAERDDIWATPTIVRTNPEPPRKMIGDFTDPDKLFAALGLNGKA
ncbi:MAG: circadian clock protein KaiB [Proteobacteria bacterium]|nr:circadian clock protein KaiB [Pseudomonadota bacterium]